jgi:hypothetical protein
VNTAVDTTVPKDVLDALWAISEPYAYVTREEWERDLAAWDVEPHYVDGKLAFVTLISGPEIHYSSFGVAPLSVALFRRWVTPIADKYGYVTTRTAKDDPRMQRINRRTGAVVTGEDEFFTHFRWDKK